MKFIQEHAFLIFAILMIVIPPLYLLHKDNQQQPVVHYVEITKQYPMELNLTAGDNITITGTYPNYTISTNK